MVALALSSNEREVHGQFTQRVLAESRSEQSSISWVKRTGKEGTQIRKSTMQLDSDGLSWVKTVEAQQLEQRRDLEKVTRRVTNENHREMVGAEPKDQATPALKPLFGKAPKGKFSLTRLKEKFQPKSHAAFILN